MVQQLADTPLDVRRRVVLLLENLRNTAIDPTNGMARLTGRVTALPGPDGEVAFYEFELDTGREIGGSPVGFVLASADGPEHMQWSFDREPPSARLARLGTGLDGPRRTVRETLRDPYAGPAERFLSGAGHVA